MDAADQEALKKLRKSGSFLFQTEMKAPSKDQDCSEARKGDEQRNGAETSNETQHHLLFQDTNIHFQTIIRDPLVW